MRILAFCVAALLSAFGAGANATVFNFQSDPFAGSTALTTPGRQIVGGEPSISFSPATDVFAFDPAIFAVGSQIVFANDVVGNLPTGGLNVVVLETFDNDGSAATPFGAGNAADLIAAQITTAGAGLFVYFNSGLNLPRLVYSTDLSDSTADLAILARMTNLAGQSGALQDFTAANFELIPEPHGLMPIAVAGAVWAITRRRSASPSPA